jgi:hypothetical protein
VLVELKMAISSSTCIYSYIALRINKVLFVSGVEAVEYPASYFGESFFSFLRELTALSIDSFEMKL